jgi:preprotein translocase subunit SecE
VPAQYENVGVDWLETKEGDVAESNRPGDRAADADVDDLFGDDESAGRGDTPKGKGALAKSGTAKSTGRASADKGPGIFGRFIRFIREIIAELRKVIWPTRKELLTYTAVVVVFVGIVVAIVAGFDVVFARAMIFIFGSGDES